MTVSDPTKVSGRVAPSRRSWKNIEFRKLLPCLKQASESSRVSPLEEIKEIKQSKEQTKGWRKRMSEELVLTDSVDYMETDLSPGRNGE